MHNCVTPPVSFCCSRPALCVPLGGRVDMAGLWVGEICAVVPAPGSTRPTIMDWRLQVLFFSPSDRNGAGLCWGAGSASTAAPYTAALVGALCLGDSDEICVYCHELCREPLDRGCELCNVGAITRRGQL